MTAVLGYLHMRMIQISTMKLLLKKPINLLVIVLHYSMLCSS